MGTHIAEVFGTHIDEIIIALLETLAFCVIIAGVLSVTVDLSNTAVPTDYLLPTSETTIATTPYTE